MSGPRYSPGTTVESLAKRLECSENSILRLSGRAMPMKLNAVERDMIVAALRGNAQAPSLTDAMVEVGARVVALRRGHKSCDELVTTTNAGKQPVWKFYTEEPRAILEAVFNAAPPSNQGASK